MFSDYSVFRLQFFFIMSSVLPKTWLNIHHSSFLPAFTLFPFNSIFVSPTVSPSPLVLSSISSLSHLLPPSHPPQWKNRYVVFKISGGGRLQFMIHKDCPPSPANEVKEIPIEEFGGIESAAKVDSEKHVFSIITTSVTDSFSTDGVEDLAEWTSLLQEYLGKGGRDE